MDKKIYIFFILIIIFSFIILSGCSENSSFLGAENPEKTKVITSNEISVPIEKVRTLNPVISKDEEAFYLHRLIYEALFVLDETLSPVGLLADSYIYGEDGTSVIITLQKDVLWHDGDAFTAADVKFSIDAYLSVLKDNKSMYCPHASKIKSADIIDDYTVLIRFNKADDAAIENLTFPIIPSHLYKKASDVQKDNGRFIPVGTGPYKVSYIEEGEMIVLDGYSGYRGSVPQNILKIKNMPGKEEAVNLFEIREINMSFLKEPDRDTLLNDKDVNVISFPSNEVEVLGYNFKHGALQDKKVRQAIAYAIDNQSIIETCYYNSGVTNDSIYYPNYLGLESSKDLYEYDPEASKKLLREAGYEGLTLSLLVNGDDHARNLAAQLVKSGLERAGISVALVPLDWDNYVKALSKGEFDLYIGGYQIIDSYDTRSILHTGYNNIIGYSNTGLDELLDNMQSAIGIDRKRETFIKIHEILTEEIPYYCLLYKTYGTVVSVDVKGDVKPYLHNIYNGCETWTLSYEINGGYDDE